MATFMRSIHGADSQVSGTGCKFTFSARVCRYGRRQVLPDELVLPCTIVRCVADYKLCRCDTWRTVCYHLWYPPMVSPMVCYYLYGIHIWYHHGMLSHMVPPTVSPVVYPLMVPPVSTMVSPCYAITYDISMHFLLNHDIGAMTI